MKEKKVAQLKAMKDLLDKEGIKYISLNHDICLRIGEYDFFPTTLKFIHRPTQIQGFGVLDLIKLVKPDGKPKESTAEKELDLIGILEKAFCVRHTCLECRIYYETKDCPIMNAEKEIKSHYWKKTEVEKILNTTTLHTFEETCPGKYFVELEDLKSALKKL